MSERIRLTTAMRELLLEIWQNGSAYPLDRNHQRTFEALEVRDCIEHVTWGRWQITPLGETIAKRLTERSEGVRVTDGIRRIIEDWRTKGVSPEETAQSLRIPIDEVKAIILQAHPAPAQPKRPEFLEPRYALEKPAGIGDNRRES